MKHATALLVLLLPGIAFADTARIVVPISQTVLPDGDIRYSVPVAIGDAPPIQALLDTGSTGLRVLHAAMPNDGYIDTGLASFYAYADGDKLAGSIGDARLKIGGAVTDDSVPFEIVTSVGCMDFRPDCSAARLAPQDYGIGGDGIAGQGFQAILGIGLSLAMGAGYTENPLPHIGAKRWIIRLPEPGDAEPGALIINPNDEDLQGFQSFQLSAEPGGVSGVTPGWVDTLPACLNNPATTQSICGPAMLDTGAPGIIAYMPGGISAPLWPPGTAAALAFSIGGGASLSIPFVADSTAGSGLLRQPAPIQNTSILAGVLPFYAYAVFYDAWAGIIGLQPRNDAPKPAQTASPSTDMEVIQMNAPAAGSPAAGSPAAGSPASVPQTETPLSTPGLPQVITP